ncbi:hypothetical protein DA075_26705 [Methylobacterium currus]|jgi:hypothetical protein|uniref:Uncharacterized protein n=1 Tax=Methylobacterium currus TaxID=2051553 RepID=A0A2R4WR73_9HYPH|nr:hypothetical protein [Methylobacterium currus]AWB24030.1 hypothetical protein DA075_26705 [Methylobacterium currus]UHC15853.1 hypothetical protein LRS73_25760 [Methylobacterium currus]
MSSDVIFEGGPVPYRPKQAVSAARQEAETVLRQIPGVQGVGEGRDGIGDPAWIAYVRDDHTARQLPARIGDRRVVAETSGEIGILPVGGA